MNRLLTALILTVLLFSANLSAQTPSDGIAIPAGTTAKLALRTPISSKLNEAGDRVKAVLDEEVLDAEGRVLIPTGTEFIGRITQTQAARRMQREASMTLVFEAMRMPFGGVLVTKGNEIRLGDETILRIRFERPVILPEQFVK